MQDGQNEISISRLPNDLESDSLRVEVETKSASHGLTVFDVVYLPSTYDSSKTYDSGSELEKLNETVSRLDARLSVLGTQKGILGKFGDSLRATPHSDGGAAHGGSSVETLEAFLDVFSTRHGKIYEETRSLQAEKATTQERINEILKKESSEQEESRSTGVSVVLLADEDGPAELVLSYGTLTLQYSVLEGSLLIDALYSRSGSILVQFIRC